MSSTTAVMSGAEMLVECLNKLGVDLVFGYPGGAILPVYDALLNSGIQHVLTKHEQAAIHAAEGYARATGKIGTVIATSGPGATNLITGIADAQMDSTPVVVITGQVPTDLIGKDAFQETDIIGITMPITKHSYQVRDVSDIPKILAEAYHIAGTGRPGPVLIDFPKNIAKCRGVFSFTREVDIRGYKPKLEPNPAQLKKIAEAVSQSRKPLLYIGGGIVHSGASEAVQEFAAENNIPVVSTLMGLGVFPRDNPLFIGMIGMHGHYAANLAAHDCDLLIACGVRFDDRATGLIQRFSPNSFKVHIDIDPAEIGKNIEIDYPLTADAKLVFELLNRMTSPPETRQWLLQLEKAKGQYALQYTQDEERIKPQAVIELLNEFTGGNAIVTTDVGQHQMWVAQYYHACKPRKLITSGGLGTMGYGLPAAIGAILSSPDEPHVVCVTGDASFQMNIQELQTVYEYGLPIKILILNNGSLGMVRQQQELFYRNRLYQSQIGSPDFAKIAEAYQIPAMSVRTPSEARDAMRRVFSVKGPVVVNFLISEKENVFPTVPPEAANTDAIFYEQKRLLQV